jgi:hypothetical protein
MARASYSNRQHEVIPVSQMTRTLRLALDNEKSEKDFRSSVAEIDNEGEEDIEDPEAANVGPIKRPMILTYSVMVGFTLILLIAVISLVIAKVGWRHIHKFES